jgi:hypothetical protein
MTESFLSATGRMLAPGTDIFEETGVPGLGQVDVVALDGGLERGKHV